MVALGAQGGEAIPPGMMEGIESPGTYRSRALNSHGFPSLPMGQPDPERAQLDAFCRQRGLSRAEALRQAFRLWLKQQQPGHNEVFGLWRDRQANGVELQQALRAEWSER
jgi:hypothetical protein